MTTMTKRRDAEAVIIGLMMLTSDHCAAGLLTLTMDDFLDERLRLLYKHIGVLYTREASGRKSPIAPITTVDAVAVAEAVLEDDPTAEGIPQLVMECMELTTMEAFRPAVRMIISQQ